MLCAVIVSSCWFLNLLLVSFSSYGSRIEGLAVVARIRLLRLDLRLHTTCVWLLRNRGNSRWIGIITDELIDNNYCSWTGFGHKAFFSRSEQYRLE